MLKKILIGLMALVLLAVAICSITAYRLFSWRSHIRALGRNNSTFAIDLYQQLRSSEGNLAFSPYSVSMALAMLYAGAEGNTETQIAQTLHFSMPPESLHTMSAESRDLLQQSETVELHIANSLWLSKSHTIRPDYLDLVREYYDTSATPVDYAQPQQTCDAINQWICDATAGKIDHVVTPGAIDDRTEMLLANAIYFKATWQEQFNPMRTKPETFHLNAEQSVEVRMMTMITSTFYADADGLQVLGLPYGWDGRLSMLVLLPTDIDGLNDLENRLTMELIDTCKARQEITRVAIGLPKFTLRVEIDLNSTLQAMGITDAFQEGLADFSGLTETPPLFLNTAIHSTFVAVNEEGTEATATTVFGATRSRGRRESPPRFWADHPFLFVIQDNVTGTILFLGRVANPTEN